MSQPRQSDRSFGLTFATLLVIVFLVAGFIFGTALAWPLWLAGLFAALALTVPGVLMPLNRLWGAFAARLAAVNNFVLLGVFFYLLVTPMGAVMRLFGWDPMTRTLRRSGSYWTPVNRDTNDDTMRDMF